MSGQTKTFRFSTGGLGSPGGGGAVETHSETEALPHVVSGKGTTLHQQQIHTRRQASLRYSTTLPHDILVSEGPAVKRRLFVEVTWRFSAGSKKGSHRCSSSRCRRTESTSIFLVNVDSVCCVVELHRLEVLGPDSSSTPRRSLGAGVGKRGGEDAHLEEVEGWCVCDEGIHLRRVSCHAISGRKS
jgi:hypothetical protein